MTEFVRWQDTKAKARLIDPTMDSEERVARRQQMGDQMLAAIRGAELADIRKKLGLTQTQLAQAAGISQARVSQIEKGESVGLDSLRSYVTGLGGTVEIVARIGNLQLDIA